MKKRRKPVFFIFVPFLIVIRLVFGIIQFIWSRILWFLAAGVLVFAFFGIRHWLYADPYFRVASVKIFPRGLLVEQEYSRLECQTAGVSLLKVDLKQQASIVEQNPKVKRATVIRKLPNEIQIFLTPRKPMVQLQTSPKGFYYLVGEDGIVMAASKQPDGRFIRLNDYGYPNKNLSVFDLYRSRSWPSVKQIIVNWQSNDVTKSESIDYLSVDHLGNISIFLSNGPELMIGDGSIDRLKKLSAVRDLLAGEQRNQMIYMDLRYADVIIKKKS